MLTKNCIHSLLAFATLSASFSFAAEPAKTKATGEAHNWTSWRGPLQTGVSTEHYKNGKLNPTPAWVYDTKGRGAPVVCDGRLFSWGYRGETTELVEVLSCLDAKTGVKIWEHEFKDFLSDTVYDRYTIGAPTVDPETKHVYLTTHYGLFMCFDFEGKELFRISMMEDFGRMSFPNSRVGSVVIESDLAILHCISSNWGADGPAADRFYAFDKLTGELVWWSMPGVSPPVDSSFSTPVFETRDGKRVFYSGTGCGNVVCVNARNGKPLWRWQACKNGVNASVLLYKGNLISVHGDENVDTSDKGRMASIKLPEKLAPAAPGADTTVLETASTEVWRNSIGSSNGSPIIVGNQIYQLDDTGVINAVNADTGAVEWTKKVATANVHASLAYTDGLIYAAMLDGRLAIFKPDTKGAELVQEVKLSGQCIGTPVISNGLLYVHTTEKFYCFTIENKGITWDKVPADEIPQAGPPAALQIIPAEVVLTPGDKAKFRIRSLDKNGFVVSDSVKATWESFIPPTAKVKSTLDAKFNDAGELVAEAGAKLSAGAFKATAEGGMFGTIRGRVLQNLPINMDFENYELNEDQPTEGLKFAYPPLPWIGARFKFDVRELNGQKVFAKTFDRILFQRATTFIAPSNLSNYTIQADVMTDGSARVKSDIGLYNQRYLITLRGNANQLEVSSNLERLKEVVPFKMIVNTWYVLKTRVDVNPDGSGVVRAKVWDKAQPEPEAWTMEVKVAMAHKNGSPGLFSFTPLNQKRAYLDNVSVTPNK
ncbi:PQQ-like beta-propeller repeat protein [soil metagenome]